MGRVEAVDVERGTLRSGAPAAGEQLGDQQTRQALAPVRRQRADGADHGNRLRPGVALVGLEIRERDRHAVARTAGDRHQAQLRGLVADDLGLDARRKPPVVGKRPIEHIRPRPGGCGAPIDDVESGKRFDSRQRGVQGAVHPPPRPHAVKAGTLEAVAGALAGEQLDYRGAGGARERDAPAREVEVHRPVPRHIEVGEDAVG